MSEINITQKIEDLGIPFAQIGYTRNVWDMQLYNGKIYLGHGDGSDLNKNPMATSIISFDTKNEQFVNEYTTNEDQIASYKVLNGKLYIPGTDSRESWDLGNFYRLDDNGWNKTRSIPNGIHVFDMEYLNGKLYTSIGNSKESPTVFISGDEGETWSPVIAKSGDSYYAKQARTYSLINFKGNIYATSSLYNMSNVGQYNRILITDGKTVYTRKHLKDQLLVNAQQGAQYRLSRISNVFNNVLYIANKLVAGNLWMPDALYTTSDMCRGRKVNLPEVSSIPMDILVRNNIVYVLAYKKISSGSYINIVYKSKDLISWNEVYRFNYDTFARSFEEVDGDFYFGIGCTTDYISSNVGRILRVKNIYK